MLFSSVLFLFRFLPATLILYYISPPKIKNLTLLICSLVFYCWGEVRFFWIMAAVILINYVCGLLMGRAKREGLRKLLVAASVVGSLSFLLYFKYAGFFTSNVNRLFGPVLPQVKDAALPLGISFYTFKCISYSIDVYRKSADRERNLVNFSLYVVMFPQLIAGPIVRYPEISARMSAPRGRVTARSVDEGISLFVFGLAKKVLLADGVFMLWTDIIGQHDSVRTIAGGVGLANASTPLAWFGVLAYTLYIYNDFSGYSMMAKGLGKMLGFDFPDNFNLPYASRSITEFWRRWHITLSSWFRDYVYIPLGGNRKGIKRQMLNLAAVWLITGFWHGAGWNFVLWGLYYCVFLVLEKLFLLKKLERGRFWPHIYTLAIIGVGWALFASGDPGVGLGVLLNKLFVPQGGVGALYFVRNYSVIITLAALFSSSLPKKLYSKIEPFMYARAAVSLVLLIICIAYIAAGGYKPFLYFSF